MGGNLRLPRWVNCEFVWSRFVLLVQTPAPAHTSDTLHVWHPTLAISWTSEAIWWTLLIKRSGILLLKCTNGPSWSVGSTNSMRPSFEAFHENMICNKYRNSFYPIEFKELLLHIDKWWNGLHAFISSVSSCTVLVMAFISPTAAIAIPVLLPDFRQTASYVSFVCAGNSIWWEHLLIQAGQAGAGWQHYSIMKVFTLLISRGNKVLSYGFDLATKCEWDVFFNMCKETIFYANAPKSVMKLRYV